MEDILDIEAVAEIEVDAENEVDIEVEVTASGPQGKDGLSAYDVYVKNGGILTETEWLSSLKGEAPVLGVDYWTETDKNDIKSYCDTYIEEQLGVIENGSY